MGDKKSDHFSYITVFGKQELRLSQKRCFPSKEQALSFSEHQKSLKSVQYSWRYVKFCIRVDNYCMWTRISCMMRRYCRIYAFTYNNYRLQYKIWYISTNNEPISKVFGVLKSCDLALSFGNNTVAQLSLLGWEKHGFRKIHWFIFE